MSPSPGRPTDWRLSDEWFASFITDLEGSVLRRRRLRREGLIPVPARVELARAFQDKTEQLRRLLAEERRRKIQGSLISGGPFDLKEGN